MSVRFLAAAAALSPFLAWQGIPGSDPAPPQADVTGHWVGWVYLDQGSDLPIRVVLAGHIGQVLLPSEDVPALPLDSVRYAGDSVRLQFRSPSGRAVRIEGTLRGHRISGRVRWGESGGEVDITRAVVPLVAVDTARTRDFLGLYRLAPGRALIIHRWFWGELRFTDVTTCAAAPCFRFPSRGSWRGRRSMCPTP